MKALRSGRKLLMIILAAVLFAALSAPAFAQCAMCKMSVMKAGNGALARSLNEGILVLLIPPVVMFCAIFIVAVKHRTAFTENQPETASGKHS